MASVPDHIKQQFRNDPRATLHCAPPSHAARKFLVLVRAGADPVPQPRWGLRGAARSFDILANFFAPPRHGCWLLDGADYVASGGLSKFSAAKQLLAPHLLDRYAGFLFLDDDVETQFDPGVFCEWLLQQRFDLAQASLTTDSIAGHRVCLNHPSCAWRETNFVEVMAPFFCGTLLRSAITDFDRSISTWGLDVLWGARYGASHRIGIIDLFTMAHRRPSSLDTGAFYRYLRSIDVDPMAELAGILCDLGLKHFDICTRHVTFLADGIRLPSDALKEPASI